MGHVEAEVNELSYVEPSLMAAKKQFHGMCPFEAHEKASDSYPHKRI